MSRSKLPVDSYAPTIDNEHRNRIDTAGVDDAADGVAEIPQLLLRGRCVSFHL